MDNFVVQVTHHRGLQRHVVPSAPAAPGSSIPGAQLELHVGCELDGAQCATRRGGNNLAARGLWDDAQRGENGADRRVRAAAQLIRFCGLRAGVLRWTGVIARVMMRLFHAQEVSIKYFLHLASH